MIPALSPKTILAIALFIFAGFFCPASAMADGESAVVINDPVNGPKLGNKDTQLSVDIKENTVRIMIDGKEILTVDKDGLHVNGNIDYTGTIADKTEANDAP